MSVFSVLPRGNSSLLVTSSGGSCLFQSVVGKFFSGVEHKLYKVIPPLKDFQDQREIFEVRSSPLCAAYQMLHSPKRDKACLLRVFCALSEEDQTLWIQLFVSRSLKDEDKSELLRSKHFRAFQGLDEVSDPSLKKELTLNLLSCLEKSTVLTHGELTSWVWDHMLERIDQCIDAFKNVLIQKMQRLPLDQQSELYGQLRAIAIEQDKLVIQDWDQGWGQSYLCQDQPNSPWAHRLVRGLDILEKNQRSGEFIKLSNLCQSTFGAELTRRLFKHCPVISAVREGRKLCFTSQMQDDILLRGRFMWLLEYYQMELISKYETLQVIFKDPSHILYQMWKEKELRILLCPVAIENVGVEVEDLLECLHSLAQDDMDFASAELLLEVILKRGSFHPRQDHIGGELELRCLKDKGRKQAACMQLLPSKYSCYKSIYSVTGEGTEITGKYKPNPPSIVAREVRGYGYDSILGMGMTPPTGFARLSIQSALESLRDAFDLAAKKHRRAQTLVESKEAWLAKLAFDEASELHERAMKQFSYFNEEIKKGLYGCMSVRLFGNEHFDSGRQGWFAADPNYISDTCRCLAIEDFLQSHYFETIKANSALGSADHLGSIQSWINKPSQRVFEFMTSESHAGQKFKEIPKVVVQLYCILGLIKGSTDGYSRNALVELRTDKKIKKILEFDDEKTMPPDNWWKRFRIWQNGLPQADLPFNRTTMVIFSRLKLLDDIQAYNRCDRRELLSGKVYEAQEKRVTKMIELFRKEILTPRDLFFEVIGGRNNFQYWTQNQGLNPWEVFEYRTGMQQENGYFCDKSRHKEVQALHQTFDVLYGGSEARAQTLFQFVCAKYPTARLIVKCNTGFGNALYIKGSLPGLDNWNAFVLLHCIDAETWILESDQPIQRGEFKLYLNKSMEDNYRLNRSIESNHASRVIAPSFSWS
jgi:hypothetical protein